MQKDFIEVIKDWHIRVCIAILMLCSLATVALGLALQEFTQSIPWWVLFLYGWSGLAVALKFQNIYYKE